MQLSSTPARDMVDPALDAALRAIDRRALLQVASLPLLLIPLGMLLVFGGFVPAKLEHSRLLAGPGLILLAQSVCCLFLAWRGYLKSAFATAIFFCFAVVLYSSLYVGLGLRTPNISAMATLCFLAAFLFGSRIANAVAFVSLGLTLIVALAVMTQPSFMATAELVQLQPTAMLIAHLGLFINTQLICNAYSRKKSLLLSHLESQSTVLEEALCKRRDALKIRQALLGQIAHNLRTPLATVRSALQLMERTKGQPERQQRYANNLRTATEKMLWQTQQFELYELLHVGQVQMLPARTDILALVEKVLSDVRKGTSRDDLDITLQTSALATPTVQVDPQHIERMLRNLLNNAQKYVQTGHIAVSLEELTTPDGHHVLRIAVEDSGPGIHASVAGQLFTPFVQGEENPANAMEGSGLGLYIIRGLARGMGGDAGIENRSEGGCRAWFTVGLASEATSFQEAA